MVCSLLQTFFQAFHVGLENTFFRIFGVPCHMDKFYPFQQTGPGKLLFGFCSSVNASIYGDTIYFIKKTPGIGVVSHADFCVNNRLPGENRVRKQLRKLILKIGDISFVRRAIEEQADLSDFKEKPSVQVIVGVLLIIISSLLGWPAVAVMGVLAVKLEEPLLAVIGGPLIYGFSHLVFLLGMYFSGAKYSLIFFRWLTRATMEKLLTWAGLSEE